MSSDESKLLLLKQRERNVISFFFWKVEKRPFFFLFSLSFHASFFPQKRLTCPFSCEIKGRRRPFIKTRDERTQKHDGNSSSLCLFAAFSTGFAFETAFVLPLLREREKREKMNRFPRGRTPFLFARRVALFVLMMTTMKTTTATKKTTSLKNKIALKTFFSKIDFDKDGQLDAEELKKYVASAIGGIEFDEQKEIDSASHQTIEEMDGKLDSDETISNAEFVTFMEKNENVATARDVKLWVKYALRFPQYAVRFEENRITIDDFPSLIMNDGELLKTHLFVENELHKASISRNLKRQMLHLGETPSVPKKAMAKVIVPRKKTSKEDGEYVVSIKWLDPDTRGTPPAHLFVVKSVIVTPGPLAVGDRSGQWWRKEDEDIEVKSRRGSNEKEWRIEEVVEWGEENALIVRNCPKGATLKFKVIAYGAFGASKAATTNEVKIPSGRSSSSLGVGNENSSNKYNSGVNRGGKSNNNHNAVVVEEPPQTFLSMFWSAMAILASTGGVFVRLYYLAKSWKQRNDYKSDPLDGSDEIVLGGGNDNPNNDSSDDVSIDAAVGIAAKSPQKAVSALIKRAEKQLLDSSRDLMEPEAEPPSPKYAANTNANATNSRGGNVIGDAAMLITEEDEKVNRTATPPPRSTSPPQSNVANSAETTTPSKATKKVKRNGSSLSLMSDKSLNAAASPAKAALNAAGLQTVRPTASVQSQTTTSTTIKKGICTDPFCSKKVKGLFKSPNAHYCGFCQHKFCFSHVATSPHGARGKCMPESECVCLKCFNVLDERKQKSLLKNSDVLQKPEILEQMARKEKAAKRWKMIKNVVKVSRMAEKRMEYTRSRE